MGFMLKLDLIDKKIIHELDLNAKSPISLIAKKIHVSREIVNYRIAKLTKENVIKGFKAFIDSSKFGYKIYRVFFKFFSINKTQLNELIKLLDENQKVFWISESDGFVDFVFGIWFKEEIEFHNFYTNLMSRFRKIIKKDYVHKILYNNYLDRAYILEKKEIKRIEFKLGGEKIEKSDDVDEKIIMILSENARTPIIDIAQKLKLDSATIIYRIKQLEKKKIIIGYRIDLNLNMLKREFYSVKIYLSDFKRKEEIRSYLKSINFVTNLIESIGGWDLEFDLEVSSSEEYHSFIEIFKENYNEISEIEFFRSPKIIKFVNAPIK
jgi:DNA-binding Lrp family transcriptional regulator